MVENPAQKYSVLFPQTHRFNYALVDYLVRALRTPWLPWDYHIEKRTRPSTKLDLSKYQNIGRNERCPCESGRKFKKCCLDRLTDEFDHYQFHFFEQPQGEIEKFIPNARVEGIDDMLSLPVPANADRLAEVTIMSPLVTLDGISVVIFP